MSDWTQGPVKFIAAGFLGGAAVVLAVWTLLTRTPAPVPPEQRNVVVVQEVRPSSASREQVASATRDDEPPPAPVQDAGASADRATSAIPSAEPEAHAPAAEPKAPTGEPALIPKKINVNAATREELELLPGIGPALAQRIIDHREKNGRFRRIEDLESVKGIGPKLLEKMRPLITVE